MRAVLTFLEGRRAMRNCRVPGVVTAGDSSGADAGYGHAFLAIGQVRRVLRPGGTFGMAEPDWETLAVADEDGDTSRRFARFLASRFRNATIGRDLARLCADAGLQVRSVEPIAVLFRDFGTADQILGLQRNTARAVTAGAISKAPAQAWLTRLAHSTVAAGFTVYLVIAEA